MIASSFLPSLKAIGDAEDRDRGNGEALAGHACPPTHGPALSEHRAGEECGLGGSSQAHPDELGEENAKAPVEGRGAPFGAVHLLLPF